MKTVLITDDASLMRHTLKETLHKFDFHVVGEAVNGIEAVEKYKKLRPHLVFMDITMPQMNGLDALKEIKRIDTNALIVMCSAIGQNAAIIKAIQAGAFDFIVKPFNIYRIQEVIERVEVEFQSRNSI